MENVNAAIFNLVKERVKMLKLVLRSRPFLRRSSPSWVWISCCATLRQVCSASLNSVLVRQLVFLEEGFLVLWVNLRQYAAVLSSLDRVVNMAMNSVGKHWIITSTNLTSCSNAGSGCFISWVVGQSIGCWCSHLGPCHHNLQFFKVSRFVSRAMRPAGLLADATRLHSHPVVISCIWETLWQIKIFHLLADVANYESTSMESVHNRILAIFKFKAGTVFCISCAKSNSKVGSVIFMTGAILDLEQNNLVITSPCWLKEHRYKHDPLSSSTSHKIHATGFLLPDPLSKLTYWWYLIHLWQRHW